MTSMKLLVPAQGIDCPKQLSLLTLCSLISKIQINPCRKLQALCAGPAQFRIFYFTAVLLLQDNVALKPCIIMLRQLSNFDSITTYSIATV